MYDVSPGVDVKLIWQFYHYFHHLVGLPGGLTIKLDSGKEISQERKTFIPFMVEYTITNH